MGLNMQRKEGNYTRWGIKGICKWNFHLGDQWFCGDHQSQHEPHKQHVTLWAHYLMLTSNANLESMRKLDSIAWGKTKATVNDPIWENSVDKHLKQKTIKGTRNLKPFKRKWYISYIQCNKL